MKLQTFEKAKLLLKRNEELTEHLHEIGKGVYSSVPISINKLGGQVIKLDTKFINFEDFIKEYTDRVKNELTILTEKFNEI